MRLRIIAYAAIVWLAASVAYGQIDFAQPGASAQIVGPSEVTTGVPAWYEVSGLDGLSVVFFPSPVLQTDSARIVAGHALFWADTPGVYDLSAIVVDWKEQQLWPLTCRIMVSGGEPEPDPEPDPDPTPDVTELIGIVFFEVTDRDDYGAKAAQVLFSPRLRELDDRFEWWAYSDDIMNGASDEGGVPFHLQPWLAQLRAENRAMPYFWLIDQDGLAVEQGPLPESVDAVIEMVRKYLPEDAP